MTTITPATPLDQLETWLDEEPPNCELYDPPPGLDPSFGWAGNGVPCSNPASAVWRLTCPSHDPMQLWICKPHIEQILAGQYTFMCGPDKMGWEPV